MFAQLWGWRLESGLISDTNPSLCWDRRRAFWLGLTGWVSASQRSLPPESDWLWENAGYATPRQRWVSAVGLSGSPSHSLLLGSGDAQPG